jgi:3-hydroxybutyrate dehydrogenase
MIREFDLKGRLAVVTGGAAGIGRAISTVLAEGGARVVVADRDAAAAQAVAAELGGIAMTLDVTDAEACEAKAAPLAAELTCQ